MKEPVGVTADMKKLEEWVNNPHEVHGVLSIIGLGGVGKTTIATALYRKVSNKFGCRASVNVSQNYDEVAVLKSILKQVMPRDRNQEDQCIEVSLEKKEQADHSMSTFKLVVPFISGHKQRGNDGSSVEKQIKVETMDRDKLVDEVKKHLKGKRYI
jgi:DNA replication protein DnaC